MESISSNKIIVDISSDYISWQGQDISLIDNICKYTIQNTSSNLYHVSNLQIELSVLLSSDIKLQELNNRYRNKNKPTNVLSFQSEFCRNVKEGNFKKVKSFDNVIFLGDMAISYDCIKKEAEECNVSFQDRLIHIVIHGCLHLLGFDHELDQDAEIMERLEQKIIYNFKETL